MSTRESSTPAVFAVEAAAAAAAASADDNLQQKFVRLSLNPNAEAFVPSSGRKTTTTEVNANCRSKANLDRTSSSNSNASDDEYRQYWRSQLPDDLISDSDFASDALPENIPGNHQYDQRDIDMGFANINRRTNGSSYDPDQQKQHLWVDGVEQDSDMHPLGLLAAEFPNFAVQSLADIYFANGGDLALTIEMLTQLELQEEGPSRRMHSRAAAAPSLTPMDFPSLPGVELINGHQQQHQQQQQQQERRPMELVPSLTRRFTASPVDSGVDFAAIVRKQVPQQPSQWQYDSAGRPQNPGFVIDTRISRDLHRVAPQPWLETGDAVANMYTDMREEARDHARVRNAYFEQARQAYLVGNKALAKELSAKGQWHNEQMKMSHGKAAEAIFQQRNASLFQTLRDGQSRIIDLHGLHVGEAIPLLRRELSAMRMASRTSSKRQLVDICVGTGHHTKGSRTPARVPLAIERYLAEDERLQFTEVQAGMLRVIV